MQTEPLTLRHSKHFCIHEEAHQYCRCARERTTNAYQLRDGQARRWLLVCRVQQCAVGRTAIATVRHERHRITFWRLLIHVWCLHENVVATLCVSIDDLYSLVIHKLLHAYGIEVEVKLCTPCFIFHAPPAFLAVHRA